MAFQGGFPVDAWCGRGGNKSAAYCLLGKLTPLKLANLSGVFAEGAPFSKLTSRKCVGALGKPASLDRQSVYSSLCCW